MPTMRILITGANGQLGRSLQRALRAHDVIALGHAALDVSDARSVSEAMEAHRPETVIHSAALTDTTRCEREPEAAHAVNALGTQHIARACSKFGAQCLVVSTNEVFSGKTTTPYAEDDEPGPVNAYGASKLEGERFAAAASPETRIVRTSWLYGEGGANFITKLLAAARSGRTLSFVNDEIATPTSAADLASAIKSMLEANATPGIYHLANEGEASRYDWARKILELAGLADAALEGVTTDQLRANGYDGPRKPPSSVLANSRARALGIRLPPWQSALAAYFERAKVATDG